MPKIVKPVMDDPKTLQRRELMRNMMLGGAALVGASAVGAPAMGAPAPQTVTPPSRTSGLPVWNVLDFGAKGDGIHDNTQAFQTAMDLAYTAGGGTVYAPAGHYLFAGNLKIPSSVTLQGIYNGPTYHIAWDVPFTSDSAGYSQDFNVTKTGTFLIPTAGKGSETAPPFIDMTPPNNCLRGLSIYYADQKGNEASPAPYPYAIFIGNYGYTGNPVPDYTVDGQGDDGAFNDNTTVEDVELIFAYNGMLIECNGRPLIRNVRGTVFRRGIYVNTVEDIGRMENVHFDNSSGSGASYQVAHLETFIFGRADWFQMHNCFTENHNIGYHFINSDSNVTLNQCGSDSAATAVQIEDCQPNWGITWSNSQFTGPVIINPVCNGPVRFSNCHFYAGATFTSMEHVFCSNCSFLGGSTYAACDQGALFNGCFFNAGVSVDAAAVFCGCDLAGEDVNIGPDWPHQVIVVGCWRVGTINGGAQAQIGLNAYASEGR